MNRLRAGTFVLRDLPFRRSAGLQACHVKRTCRFRAFGASRLRQGFGEVTPKFARMSANEGGQRASPKLA